jgi:hypothetical protein
MSSELGTGRVAAPETEQSPTGAHSTAASHPSGQSRQRRVGVEVALGEDEECRVRASWLGIVTAIQAIVRQDDRRPSNARSRAAACGGCGNQQRRSRY